MSKDEWFDAACAAWVAAGMLDGTLPLFDAEDRRVEGIGPQEYVDAEIEIRRVHRVKWIEKRAPFATGDIGHEIDGIKEWFDAGRDPEAHRLGKLVWGTDAVNQHGVFDQCVMVQVASKGRASAKIGVYEVRRDAFVHCVSLHYNSGGFGYMPSMWSADPHPTAADARAAAMDELIERLTDDSPNFTEAERKTRNALLAQVGGKPERGPLVGSYQPTLF